MPRKQTRQQDETVAYHEAGHLVMAWIVGIQVRNATIVGTTEYDGRVQHARIFRKTDLEPSDAKAEKMILTCLAGPIAQKRYRPRSYRAYHGSEDDWQATDLAFRAKQDPVIVDAWLRYLDKVAKRLVELNWPVIEVAAARLLECRTLTFYDVTELKLDPKVQEKLIANMNRGAVIRPFPAAAKPPPVIA